MRIRDVIEIPTPAGLAYAQYVYRHDTPSRHGPLIRVLPGLYETRQSDFAELVRGRERFVIFCPVGLYVWRGSLAVVGNEEIPKSARKFPLFRAPGGIDNSGRVLNWWLWDGEQSWRIDGLTPEQHNLPVRFIVDDVALMQWVAEGWAPADYK